MASEVKSCVAFLTSENRRAIGHNLQRTYPVRDTVPFDDLLKAIAQATQPKP